MTFLDRMRLTRRTLAKGAALTAGAMLANVKPASANVHRGGLGMRHGPWRPDDDDDIALVNGNILTLDGRNSVASSVAIRGDRIVDVGVFGRPVRQCKQTIDLRGATVIPGLIDSHQHFIRACHNPGYETRGIESATSILELQQALFVRARGVPAGGFLTCIGGWNRNGLIEKRLPTPAELDAGAPGHPVYLSETSGGGQAVTNTAGKSFFASAGVTVNADGTLNATAALNALRAAQTAADRARGTADGIAWVSGLGLTGVADQGGIPFADWKDATNLWRSGKLDIRLRQYFNGNDSPDPLGYQTFVLNNHNKIGDDAFRVLGVGERVPGDLNAACAFLGAQGWTLTLHSLALTENQQQVAAFQLAAQTYDIASLRWQLHHINDITPDLLQTIAKLGIAVGLQSWRYLSTGPAPFRSCLDLGIPCGGGTDATNVAAQNPWLHIYHMVTGLNNAGTLSNPGQQISRIQALKMFTSGSAYLTFDEDKVGSIEEGKLADLVVLSDNVLTVPDDKLKKLSSNLTILGGNVVHAAGRFAALAG